MRAFHIKKEREREREGKKKKREEKKKNSHPAWAIGRHHPA
jgi:hypothetical protein